MFAAHCRRATSRFCLRVSKTKLVGTIPWRYRLELRQLRYFVAVARERNFTRAAEALRIAQPPLSRQIQQLEDELGVTLIERGSRPVRLTDGGRLLYEQAVQVLERVEETKAIARRLQELGRRRFSFGFVPSTLYGYLPEVIRRYRDARPGVELTLLELTSLEQIAALKEGRIDVGFGRIPFDDPLVERRLLRNERLIRGAAVRPSARRECRGVAAQFARGRAARRLLECAASELRGPGARAVPRARTEAAGRARRPRGPDSPRAGGRGSWRLLGAGIGRAAAPPSRPTPAADRPSAE